MSPVMSPVPMAQALVAPQPTDAQRLSLAPGKPPAELGAALAGSGMTSLRTRERLVQRLTSAGIDDPRVLGVLRAMPRHLFVDEALASRAYEDSALPIGHGQTISQPYTVARMTMALLPSARSPDPLGAPPVRLQAGMAAEPDLVLSLSRPGHKPPPSPSPSPLLDTVLEIGTGSGFQTAVLAMLARRVYSIERLGVLHTRAALRLRALKLRNVRLKHDDGTLGWPEYAPFDAVLITAAADGVPRRLAEQLSPGGRMVLPLNRGGDQLLLRLTRTRFGFKHEVLEPVTFVPLLGGVA